MGVVKALGDLATDFIPGGKVAKIGLSALGINPFDEASSTKSAGSPRPYVERRKTLTREIIEREVLGDGLYNGKSNKSTSKKSISKKFK